MAERFEITDEVAVPAIELTAAEGRTLVDERAQQVLGISGEEFVRRWQAGELEGIYNDPSQHVSLNGLVMLLPFWSECAAPSTE